MDPDDSVAADITALRNMAKEFAEGFNRGEVDRIMRFYDDVYVDINLRHPVQSKPERAAYYAQVIRRGGIRIDVQPDEILVRGEFAFVRGRILLMRKEPSGTTAPQAEPPSELRYLEIVRRAPDGSWKVMWGMDGPVQEYDPAPSPQP